MLRLAAPVVLAEVGWVTMGLADTLMVGGLGPEAIGAVGISSSLFLGISIFAMGLLLGIVGIYGVISYVAAARTREIGIRLALGAAGRDVTGLFLRQGIVLALTGVAIGLVAAAGLIRVMSALLFGVSPIDPVTYLTVALGLTATALLASYIPAARAARVDPASALRWGI